LSLWGNGHHDMVGSKLAFEKTQDQNSIPVCRLSFQPPLYSYYEPFVSVNSSFIMEAISLPERTGEFVTTREETLRYGIRPARKLVYQQPLPFFERVPVKRKILDRDRYSVVIFGISVEPVRGITPGCRPDRLLRFPGSSTIAPGWSVFRDRLRQ